MVTNNKEYMKAYMKEYNLTDKCRDYKMSYYDKNKEKLKKMQRDYYHLHKLDPNYSHFLEKRLELQKKAYSEKRMFVTPYHHSPKYYSKKIPMKITKGQYTISFN